MDKRSGVAWGGDRMGAAPWVGEEAALNGRRTAEESPAPAAGGGIKEMGGHDEEGHTVM